MALKSLPKAEFEKLKTQVLTLSTKQRTEVLALIGAAGQVETGFKEGEERHLRQTFDAVAETLKAKLVVEGAPFDVVAPKLIKELRAADEALGAFLTQHVPQGMSESERLGCLLFLAGLTARHMNRRTIPVSHKSLLQQLANVALVVDEELPGYAASGLIARALAPVLTK